MLSNDPADKLEKMRGKLGLEFPTLIDPGLDVAASFGVRKEKGDLPHPTAVVIDPGGIVQYIRVDENYARRPKPEELLQALKAPAGESG